MPISRRIKGNIENPIFLLLVFILNCNNCKAQAACEDSLNFISEAYRNGEWNICKNSAIIFIKNSSKSTKKQKYASYCENNISQVYNYLIKSLLRLYDLDSAAFYYFDALKKEVTVELDSTDRSTMGKFGKVKRHSYGAYFGSVSTNFKEGKIFNEFKGAALFGINFNSFLELSYNKRIFNHNSGQRVGIFGKPLEDDPAKFPNYNFSFSGNARFIDLAFFHKLFVYKSNRNDLYFSPGLYVNYYLNSYVHDYKVTIVNNPGDTDIVVPTTHSKRYEKIESPSITMDLKRLYRERFNCGFFIGYGSTTKFQDRWEVLAEIRYTIGKNYSYDYPDFHSYKVGVNYFTIIIGITRRYNKIKMKHNSDTF